MGIPKRSLMIGTTALAALLLIAATALAVTNKAPTLNAPGQLAKAASIVPATTSLQPATIDATAVEDNTPTILTIAAQEVADNPDNSVLGSDDQFVKSEANYKDQPISVNMTRATGKLTATTSRAAPSTNIEAMQAKNSHYDGTINSATARGAPNLAWYGPASTIDEGTTTRTKIANAGVTMHTNHNARTQFRI